jgi:hypothetical protein
MEPSLAALRPQSLIFTGLGMRQPSGLNNFAIAIAIAFGLTAPSRAQAWRPPDAWRSYAVYSGALSLRHYKPPRRLS